jgi:DNA-binding PadR family transcriptional regulator
MEAEGWVTSTWDEDGTQGPPRRVYRLTDLGNDVLGRSMQDLQQARGLIDGLMDDYRQHMQESNGEYHTHRSSETEGR